MVNLLIDVDVKAYANSWHGKAIDAEFKTRIEAIGLVRKISGGGARSDVMKVGSIEAMAISRCGMHRHLRGNKGYH